MAADYISPTGAGPDGGSGAGGRFPAGVGAFVINQTRDRNAESLCVPLPRRPSPFCDENAARGASQGVPMIRRLTSCVALAIICSAAAAAQQAALVSPAARSDAEIEAFLQHARVVKTRSVSKGVTGTLRATLTDGTVTHDAQIQTIDERKSQFSSPSGTEFNFRDSWMYNVAAYRLDRLIGQQLVPPSVKRSWQSHDGAFTWWVDDVMMEEGERLKRKISPKDSETWNEQMQLVRVFDQLIYNVDRNLGNLVIDNNWRVWAIDHTRAFRTLHALKAPKNITRYDRRVLERLRALDAPSLKRALGDFLTPFEIEALLARRDAIVALLDKAGPATLFDRRP